jgi:DNA-binding transcriptional LysR family regulator
MQTMDWGDLRYLLAIARAGTLSGAARRLEVNQTTVSRRLAAAETALASRLFDRVDGKFVPTEMGAVAISRAAQVEEQVQALESGIEGDDAAAGPVRLTTVPILINRLIVPALPAFCAAYPLIKLELIAEPRNVDLTRREADIALRLSQPERGGTALTRRIGRLDYAVYGRRGSVSDLPWINYEESLRHLPQVRWVAAATKGNPTALLVNDAEGILHGIQAGLGKSLLPCRIAGLEPLLERLGPGVALSRDVWLLTHRDLRRQHRIDAVVSWLQSLFAQPG